MQWLDALDPSLALTNCHTDLRGDWYRDPWGWPELDWVVKRKPELLAETVGRNEPRRFSRIDVPKENFGIRPAVVFHPLDRLAYQALVDRISVSLHHDLQPWVFGWRLPRAEPVRGRYVSNDKEWSYYRQRLRTLALRYPVALQTDIVSFFASIPIERLIERIYSRTTDGVVARLGSMLRGWARTADRPGLPQRCHASSILANIYLGPLDDTIAQCLPPAEEGRSAGAARWMDDIWVSAMDRGSARASQLRLERTMRDLGLHMGRGKTEVLEGEAMQTAAWAIEHGSVDLALESDPLSRKPLAELVEQIVASPETISRHSVRFAEKRVRDTADFELAEQLATVSHRLPHAADLIARLFRAMNLWETRVDWFLEYAASPWGAVEWSVAQLGTMFPSDAAGVDAVADLFRTRLPLHRSLPLVAVAAQRLAAWQPVAARDLLRETARDAVDPLERRILALAALGAGEDRSIIARVLGEFEDNRVTLAMLQERHFQHVPANPDFAG